MYITIESYNINAEDISWFRMTQTRPTGPKTLVIFFKAGHYLHIDGKSEDLEKGMQELKSLTVRQVVWDRNEPPLR